MPLLSRLMLPCAYKQIFGIDCPACGAQRATYLLFEGNFKESFFMFPPLILCLILILLFGIYLIFRKEGLKKFLYKYAAIVFVLVMINYIVKLISGNAW